MLSHNTKAPPGAELHYIYFGSLPCTDTPEAAEQTATHAMNSYHVYCPLGPLTTRAGTINVNCKKCQMLMEVLGISP